MSYNVYLKDASGIVEVESHQEGGVICVGGEPRADMSVTYNYAKIYSLIGFSMWDLNGKQASETIIQLQSLVEQLGDRPYKDYWAPTPGNAGHALAVMLGWARQYPDARWEIT